MQINELTDYRDKVLTEAQTEWSFACFYILSSFVCYLIYSIWYSNISFFCIWISTYFIGFHYAKTSILKDELKGINLAIEEERQAKDNPTKENQP